MKERLASVIFNDLEKDILQGIYPINTKLPPERELAEKYNTSRFIIREAIAMLINAGLAETRPQSGTYIKNYLDEITLDSLIRILQNATSMDYATFESTMNFKMTNDVANVARAAELIKSEDLEILETLILKKKLNNSPRVLAECDYKIDNEIAKAAKNIISLAVTISLKPIKIHILEMIYSIPESRDMIIEKDIILFNALSEHDVKKSINAVRERLQIGIELMLKHTVVENGLIKVVRDIDSPKKNKNLSVGRTAKSN